MRSSASASTQPPSACSCELAGAALGKPAVARSSRAMRRALSALVNETDSWCCCTRAPYLKRSVQRYSAVSLSSTVGTAAVAALADFARLIG
jgi:hypothetical protein